MPKLTKRIVEAAEPGEAGRFVWCSDLPGFGARVFPSGKRVYYIDYRNQEGRRKRIAIGQHGKVTVDEARKLAIAALGDVVKGGDPAADRATRRNAMTVSELCDRYMAAARKGLILTKGGRPKKASTLKVDQGRVEHHIKPLLGRRLVRDLNQTDVQRFLRDVIGGKTAAARDSGKLRGRINVLGGAGAGARAVGLLGGLLTYAKSEGIIIVNPALGVQVPAANRRTRRLTTSEYRQFGDAIRALEEEGMAWQAVAGFQLLALTGCRLREINDLKWSEVDLEGSCLRLGDTKTGASIRPVGGAVLRILAGLERRRGCPYVLPATRSDGAYGSLMRTWRRVVKVAGLEDVTCHTLRHSFASIAGDLGYSESTIGAMIGHRRATVTSRYVHHLDAVLVAAADRVAGEIESAVRIGYQNV